MRNNSPYQLIKAPLRDAGQSLNEQRSNASVAGRGQGNRPKLKKTTKNSWRKK